MRVVLMALPLLLISQSSDIDSLLKLLNDDSIEVREKAAKDLLELGEKAEPALRRHSEGASPELAIRCRDLLKRIDEARRIAKVFPPIRRLSLAAKGRSAREVLGDLATWANVPVSLENVEDVKLDADLKDLTLFEALDSVGRKINRDPFFGIRSSSENLPTLSPLTLQFEEGFAVAPRSYHSHFRVSIRKVRVAKELAFQRAPSVETRVDVRLDWSPAVLPEGKLEFLVESITDSKGKELYKGDAELAPVCYWIPQQFPDCFIEDLAQFESAADGHVLTMKGFARLRFTLDKDTLRFDDPRKCVGELRAAGDTRIVLKECSISGGEVKVVLEVRGPDSLDDDEVQSLRVMTKDGGCLGWKEQDRKYGDKGDPDTITQICKAGPSEVAAVEFVVIRKWHEEKFEFTLKDIPLPK